MGLRDDSVAVNFPHEICDKCGQTNMQCACLRVCQYCGEDYIKKRFCKCDNDPAKNDKLIEEILKKRRERENHLTDPDLE